MKTRYAVKDNKDILLSKEYFITFADAARFRSKLGECIKRKAKIQEVTFYTLKDCFADISIVYNTCVRSVDNYIHSRDCAYLDQKNIQSRVNLTISNRN